MWALSMAWRDGRASWKRLGLYATAGCLGIAGLIAAGSFRHNIEKAIQDQAKPLLGSDLVVKNRRVFSNEDNTFLRSLPHPSALETRVNTVAFFPTAAGGRLLEIRAVEQGFPYYGEIKSDPPEAASQLFQQPSVLLEESLLNEFNLKLGDPVQLGNVEFPIIGALKALPGEAFASLFTAPRVMMALPVLEQTGLMRDASLARHRLHYKIPDETQLNAAMDALKKPAEEKRWGLETVTKNRESLGERADNATRFLKLAALIALFLGCIGLAGIMASYVKDKWTIAATLKCLGAPTNDTLAVFIIQAAFLGTLTTLMGTGLGILLQAGLPLLIKDIIKVPIPFFLSIPSLIGGAGAGFGMTFLFTLFPLMKLRRATALSALRAIDEPPQNPFKDPVINIMAVVLSVAVFFLVKTQTADTRLALATPLSLGAAMALLSALSYVTLRFMRRHMAAAWPYAVRQGLANLFRPHNRTMILVPALGLGAALIFCIVFVQQSLNKELSFSTNDNRPTVALIDVQSDQRQGIAQRLNALNLNVADETPIVSMRIQEINGQSIYDLKKDDDDENRPAWALRREYRSSYRNHLTPGEKNLAGTWPPPSSSSPGSATGDPTLVPISLEEGIAQDLGVALGDTITFNVQGLPVKTQIASIRKVDWFQLRPNFFAVFPEGVLEDAPQFFVLLVKTTTVEETALVQKLTREHFSNVSAVDLKMVMETLDSYFGKVSMALSFMAFFVVLTGLLILAGALMSGRHERLREAALYRLLGTPAKTIHLIHFVEYSFIGLSAGVAGLALGLTGAWSLSTWVFKIPFTPSWVAMLLGTAAMVFLSAITGALMGRGLLNHPPLQTLREND
jgi:putative ABC transport system permease protein